MQVAFGGALVPSDRRRDPSVCAASDGLCSLFVRPRVPPWDALVAASWWRLAGHVRGGSLRLIARIAHRQEVRWIKTVRYALSRGSADPRRLHWAHGFFWKRRGDAGVQCTAQVDAAMHRIRRSCFPRTCTCTLAHIVPATSGPFEQMMPRSRGRMRREIAISGRACRAHSSVGYYATRRSTLCRTRHNLTEST